MKPKTRILVVDDDPNLRKTLADILKLKGYESVIADTGAEAIAAVEKAPVSLALIDLILPDMPGVDVMAAIKAISPLTEAIILTGNASMETAIEATRLGAYSYLLKPYRMDELLRNIQHGVERQQSREEILRLASFPNQNPNPIVELNPAGEITYLNPATERLLPDLRTKGLAHPLLNGLTALIASLRKSQRHAELLREVEIRGTTYELHISCVVEVDLIRIYAMDITQRKLAEQKVHLLATTDSLTGIVNRREFTRILKGEMERTIRYGTPLSLMMYDLDSFKQVNDTYGHDVGDDILQAVTRLVNDHIRGVDVAARWGGEEFMVLMPQSNLAAAGTAAEKLRRVIETYRFDKVNIVTLSFGVTDFAPRDDSNSLLKRVDQALYMAKARGKNRVEFMVEGDREEEREIRPALS